MASITTTSAAVAAATATRATMRLSQTLIGRFSAHEGVEGGWGNREVPPPWTVRRGHVGETWFPPWERAGGERHSSRHSFRVREKRPVQPAEDGVGEQA